MARLQSKKALITGAASGIGKASAERLAQEGADLALADLNHVGARAVADQLAGRYGVRAYAVAFDASSPESCRKMVEDAAAQLGGLDIVCNIAGIMDWGKLEDFSETAWERMLRINLSSLFYVTQRAMPYLVQSKGCVVNMSSAAGLIGIAYTTAYCAAKAGVIGMTKSLAVEFASRGVRVNAICPGGVKTPMHNATEIPQGLDQTLLDRHWPKMGELNEPEDIAASVAFLASADARYITGVALTIDGGQTAG